MWLVVRGSWLVVRDSWFVARGSWFVARGSWLVAREPTTYFFGGGMVIGFVGPRSLSDFTFSQIAFCTSFVGAGAQPSRQARR